MEQKVKQESLSSSTKSRSSSSERSRSSSRERSRSSSRERSRSSSRERSRSPTRDRSSSSSRERTRSRDTNYEPKQTPKVKCLICQKLFTRQSNLNLHIRKVHKILKETPKDRSKSSSRERSRSRDSNCDSKPKLKGVICPICEKLFYKKSNLDRHIRKVHHSEPTLVTERVTYDKSMWNYKCLEENCNSSFQKNEGLIDHLKEVHNLLFETEEMVFNNYNEFESWKAEYEAENMCNYTVSNTWKSSVSKVTHYKCNRTKTGKKIKQERNRRQKKQGSCKLNYACTSDLKLICTADKLTVHFQKTHYGHSLDLQHLRISKYDRGSIAAKLMSGETKTSVIDSVKETTEVCAKRLDMLSPKDVENIRRAYNIVNTESKIRKRRRKNEPMSAYRYVEADYSPMPDDNQVMFYKNEANNLVSQDLLSGQNITKKQNLDNLMVKINQTFSKLQSSDLSNLEEGTIYQMVTHLNILNSLVEIPTQRTLKY